MAPAGFWRRFAAHTLDVAVIALGSALVGFVLALLAHFAGLSIPVETAESSRFELLANLAGIAVGWLYYALQESGWRQATLGKRLIGIEVTDLAGERISFARATGRFFAALLSYLTLFIGFLMAGFTARRQALHDMVAGTLVVRTPGASTTLGWVLFALVTMLWGVVLVVALSMAWPAWQAEQARAGLPPVVAAGEEAAAAIERYVDTYGDFPVALEDTDYAQSLSPRAPLVSVDPDQVRLTVAARDGSMFLVMTPLMVADGIEWMCQADPDEPANYPASCVH